MITTHGLTKRFGSRLVVDSVDLDVRPGDIYGFLGANGSGKTTTVRMLLGLVLATSGEARIFDEPMPKAGARVLPRIGALVETPAAYNHLSGRTNLALLDATGQSGDRRSRDARITEALSRVGLADIDRRPLKAYSLGMRQRLGLAFALLRTPELLVLDEPTNGLDPQGIREIRDLLLELHAGGATIFLSSHLLAEVEQLCTRVGVLDRGKLIVQDSLESLQAPTGRTIVHSPDATAAVALLDGRVESRNGDQLIVRADDPASLNTLLVRQGIRVSRLALERRSLEQTVLQLTNGPGR